MSIESIRVEIEERQGQIQSLHSRYQELQAELDEVRYEERRSGNRLCGSDSIPREMERIRNEISSLESDIESLVDQARKEAAKAEAARPKLSPLEALGISALMRADGKMSDEQFSQILSEVRKALSQ